MSTEHSDGSARRLCVHIAESLPPGCRGQIFVRPDSPLKIFTGQTASYDSFDRDVEFMAFYDFPTDSPIIVSTPKDIEYESRFVVVDGAVVAGSQNKVGDSIRLSEADLQSWSLAGQVAKSGFQPDRVWVMDVCKTLNGEYRLLEIGAFSFSHLYGCNKLAVVEAVSSTAESIWQQQNA